MKDLPLGRTLIMMISMYYLYAIVGLVIFVNGINSPVYFDLLMSLEMSPGDAEAVIVRFYIPNWAITAFSGTPSVYF